MGVGFILLNLISFMRYDAEESLTSNSHLRKAECFYCSSKQDLVILKKIKNCQEMYVKQASLYSQLMVRIGHMNWDTKGKILHGLGLNVTTDVSGPTECSIMLET